MKDGEFQFLLLFLENDVTIWVKYTWVVNENQPKQGMRKSLHLILINHFKLLMHQRSLLYWNAFLHIYFENPSFAIWDLHIQNMHSLIISWKTRDTVDRQNWRTSSLNFYWLQSTWVFSSDLEYSKTRAGCPWKLQSFTHLRWHLNTSESP